MSAAIICHSVQDSYSLTTLHEAPGSETFKQPRVVRRRLPDRNGCAAFASASTGRPPSTRSATAKDLGSERHHRGPYDPFGNLRRIEKMKDDDPAAQSKLQRFPIMSRPTASLRSAPEDGQASERWSRQWMKANRLAISAVQCLESMESTSAWYRAP